MLFEEEKKPGDLFARLKEKVGEVARAVRELREENASLKKELQGAREEAAKVKARLEFYEGERQQLQTVVEDLLRDFEKVSQ